MAGRISARPSGSGWAIRSGRWEGNTLVVDTTNFTDKVLYRGAAENLHLVERFTSRTGRDRLSRHDHRSDNVYATMDACHSVCEYRRRDVRVCLSRGNYRWKGLDEAGSQRAAGGTGGHMIFARVIAFGARALVGSASASRASFLRRGIRREQACPAARHCRQSRDQSITSSFSSST